MGADDPKKQLSRVADVALNYVSFGAVGVDSDGKLNRGAGMRALDEITGANFERQQNWQKQVINDAQTAQDKQAADLMKFKQQQDTTASMSVDAARKSAIAATSGMNPFSRITGTGTPLGGMQSDFLGV